MQTEPNNEKGALQSAIRVETDEGAPDFTPEQWAEIKGLLGGRINYELTGKVSAKSIGEILDEELAEISRV